MTLVQVMNIFRDGIFQLLLLVAPVLLISMVVGLIISVIQATTSIQEQTITFVPKIVAIFGSLVIFGPWMFQSMAEYTIRLFEAISKMNG